MQSLAAQGIAFFCFAGAGQFMQNRKVEKRSSSGYTNKKRQSGETR
jgi:hypothetical protein